MNKHEQLINTALDNYPLATLPKGFVRQTMKQVAPKPTFRFGLLDLLLPSFFILFFISIIVVGLIMLQLLNPFLLLELQAYFQLLIFYASQASSAAIAAAMLGTLLSVTAVLAGFLLWFDEIQRIAFGLKVRY